MADEKLADEVASLKEQVELLRQVLDEVLVELTWANDNARDLPAGSGAISAVHRITSMSLAWISFQPRMLDPSKPRPASKISSL